MRIGSIETAVHLRHLLNQHHRVQRRQGGVSEYEMATLYSSRTARLLAVKTWPRRQSSSSAFADAEDKDTISWSRRPGQNHLYEEREKGL